jgi:hypothetical protein
VRPLADLSADPLGSAMLAAVPMVILPVGRPRMALGQ